MQILVIMALFLGLLSGEVILSGDPSAGEILRKLTVSQTLASAAGLILVFWALTRMVDKLLRRKLERLGLGNRKTLRLPGRIEAVTRVILLAAYALSLTLGGWAQLVYGHWRLQRFVLLDELVLLLPFLVMQLLKWSNFYPVNRLIREYILEGQLADGLSSRPVWTRGQYLSFHIRHGLLILLAPMLLILGYKDVLEILTGRALGGRLDETTIMLLNQGLTVMGAVIIFIFSPLLLRRIWQTRPLPEGPLRRRLQEFCRQVGLRYRDILLWETHSSVANAAVMGLFGPIRYVLLSDALIENMSDEQIEAVFGHEAGHVQHNHILYLGLFVIGSTALGGLLLQWGSGLLEKITLGHGPFASQFMLQSSGGIVLGLLWLHVFGWVSRRLERQADVQAAISVGTLPRLEPEPLPENPGRLSGRGAAVVGSALQRIAWLNGISAESRSWRHSSIGSRAAYLMHLAQREGALLLFGRKLRVLKTAIILTVAAGGLGWWLSSNESVHFSQEIATLYTRLFH